MFIKAIYYLPVTCVFFSLSPGDCPKSTVRVNNLTTTFLVIEPSILKLLHSTAVFPLLVGPFQVSGTTKQNIDNPIQ